MKKNFKFDLQKLFCFASFFFILGCIIIYGTTFIKLYLKNKEELLKPIESKPFYEQLISNNYDSKTFKKINNTYYYTDNPTNNYISYSNNIWRIIKINEDNSILLISENTTGLLAYGDINSNYNESNIINWLNNNENKYFMNQITEAEKYLKITNTCIDTISNIDNITCNTFDNTKYINLLSLEDYLNTGGNTSFINNGKYTYLSNKNEENKIWYITNNGTIDTTDGTEILGIKPTITISGNTKMISGDGTINNPYTFSNNNLIGSYVKLDNDIWRIYHEKDGIIKLILQDYIKENDSNLTYQYSNNTYYHNDTIKNSLAYYLNNTYYNSLSYKNLIIENTYNNGLYGKENNYNYQDISKKTIKTKVSLPSIEDIKLNNNLTNYFTSTGKLENEEAIYIIKDNNQATTKLVTTKANIIPCISIKKENLTLGSGTLNDPYRTEWYYGKEKIQNI